MPLTPPKQSLGNVNKMGGREASLLLTTILTHPGLQDLHVVYFIKPAGSPGGEVWPLVHGTWAVLEVFLFRNGCWTAALPLAPVILDHSS